MSKINFYAGKWRARCKLRTLEYLIISPFIIIIFWSYQANAYVFGVCLLRPWCAAVSSRTGGARVTNNETTLLRHRSSQWSTHHAHAFPTSTVDTNKISLNIYLICCYYDYDSELFGTFLRTLAQPRQCWLAICCFCRARWLGCGHFGTYTPAAPASSEFIAFAILISSFHLLFSLFRYFGCDSKVFGQESPEKIRFWVRFVRVSQLEQQQIIMAGSTAEITYGNVNDANKIKLFPVCV